MELKVYENLWQMLTTFMHSISHCISFLLHAACFCRLSLSRCWTCEISQFRVVVAEIS
jgi:hypothetical protein